MSLSLAELIIDFAPTGTAAERTATLNALTVPVVVDGGEYRNTDHIGDAFGESGKQVVAIFLYGMKMAGETLIAEAASESDQKVKIAKQAEGELILEYRNKLSNGGVVLSSDTIRSAIDGIAAKLIPLEIWTAEMVAGIKAIGVKMISPASAAGHEALREDQVQAELDRMEIAQRRNAVMHALDRLTTQIDMEGGIVAGTLSDESTLYAALRGALV